MIQRIVLEETIVNGPPFFIVIIFFAVIATATFLVAWIINHKCQIIPSDYELTTFDCPQRDSPPEEAPPEPAPTIVHVKVHRPPTEMEVRAGLELLEFGFRALFWLIEAMANSKSSSSRSSSSGSSNHTSTSSGGTKRR